MSDRNPSQGTNLPNDLVADEWTNEEKYWQENWRTRPYAAADLGFDYYKPAYQYGYEASRQYRGRSWNDVEGDLRREWEDYKYRGKTTWDRARDAVRDAWNRATSNVDGGRNA